MPWARIDDSLYDHPKLDALGSSRLPCIGLSTLALSWSNRWLTDGFIPAARVPRLGGTIPLADKLVAAGLWEREGDDYRIHDFAEYNDTRDSVLANRDAAKQRMRRVRSGCVRENVERSSPDVRDPRPVPSRPVHTRPVPSPRNAIKNGDGRTPDEEGEYQRIRQLLDAGGTA